MRFFQWFAARESGRQERSPHPLQALKGGNHDFPLGLGTLPVRQDWLAYADERSGCRLGAVGDRSPPLGQDAVVLRPALRRPVVTEKEVVTATDAVGQGDNGLSTLFVQKREGVVDRRGMQLGRFCGSLPQISEWQATPSDAGRYA